MSLTDQAENDILDLQFTNVAAPNWGDAGGLQPSAVAGSIHASLHTATLAETHTDQTQSEAAYGAYARLAIARSVAQWTVAAGVVDNDNELLFVEATGGVETETDLGLGFALSGTGYLQIYGALNLSVDVKQGVQPRFKVGTLDITLT